MCYGLEEVKKDIHRWNAQEFVWVNDNIRLAHDCLQEVHNLIFVQGLYQSELDAQAALGLELQNKEMLLRDSNSALFHQLLSSWKVNKHLSLLTIEVVVTFDNQAIRDHVVSYYQNMFLDTDRVTVDKARFWGRIIGCYVRFLQLKKLKFSFSMDAYSASGPYGFSGFVFSALLAGGW